MRTTPTPSRSIQVVAASAVVVILAGLLLVRLGVTARSAEADVRPRPAPAEIPEPLAFDAASLTIPCWGCPQAKEWPLRFRTDLDMLAPLGTGTANAAAFFAAFEKGRGPRAAELAIAWKLRFEHPKTGMVFPYDLPLVREAEPWCDQATMRYYPDFFPLEGASTRVTNLLFQLTLARTWVAEGYDSTDPDEALACFRRAIRLGRLLRQEDVVIISDLVGLACIRMGTEGIYELAARLGDTKLALLASAVLGEHAPQRLLTAARLTETDLEGAFVKAPDGALRVQITDGKLDTIVDRARSAPDRRFRCEAILELNLVRFFATPAQQQRALDVLDELSRSDDTVIAATARYGRDERPGAEFLTSLQTPPKLP